MLINFPRLKNYHKIRKVSKIKIIKLIRMLSIKSFLQQSTNHKRNKSFFSSNLMEDIIYLTITLGQNKNCSS